MKKHKEKKYNKKEKIKKLLKNKKIMLASWNSANVDDYQYRDWKPLLEELFGRFILFATASMILVLA